PGVSDAEVRPRLRQARAGGVRGEDAGRRRAEPAQESRGPGLRVDAAGGRGDDVSAGERVVGHPTARRGPAAGEGGSMRQGAISPGPSTLFNAHRTEEFIGSKSVKRTARMRAGPKNGDAH